MSLKDSETSDSEKKLNDCLIESETDYDYKKSKKHSKKSSKKSDSSSILLDKKKPKKDADNDSDTFSTFSMNMKPFNFNVIKGDQGPQGERGPRGDRGPAGPDGPEGPRGPRGKRGKTGPQGIQGEQGPKGKRGHSGKSFTWKGLWIPDHEYCIYDVVYYNGSSYIAINKTNTIPEESSTDWDILAKGGETIIGPPGP